MLATSPMAFKAAYISYADYGGPLIHTKEFINAFRKLAPDLVTHCPFLAKDLSYPGPGKESFFNQVFAYLPPWTRQVKLEFHQLRKLLRDWAKWRYFLELYKTNRVDIAIIRSDAYIMAPIYAANRCGIPYLLEVNGILSKDKPGRITKLFEKYCLSTTSGIFVVCDVLAQFFTNGNISQEKIRIIPNGVSIEAFQSPDLSLVPDALRLELKNKIVVGYAGTFTPYHDMPALLIGFAQALSKVPNISLLLIGQGKFEQETKQRVNSLGIENAVRFTGRVPHHLVPSYLQLCSVVVNPMRQIYPEGFHGAPIKMFEYMAAKRAIISTELPSLRQLLEDSAVFVSPGSAEEWRDALLTLAKDEMLRQKKGNEAFEHLLKRGYTWDENARKIYE